MKNSEGLGGLELAYRMGHEDISNYLQSFVEQEVNWREKSALARLMDN